MGTTDDTAVVTRFFETRFHDQETARSLVAEDARWIIPGSLPLSGTYEGRDAIHAFMSSVVVRGRTDPDESTSESVVLTPTQEWIARGRVPFIRHYTATTQIDVLSETHAKARSYYLFLTVHGLDHWGRYLDEFAPVDGKWLITHRREITDAAFAGGWGARASGGEGIEHITRPLAF